MANNGFLKYWKSITAVVVFIGFIAGGVVAVPNLLVTRESYEIEEQIELLRHETVMKELTGVSINQQQISARNNVKWLEADIRNFKIRYGNPPYQDPRVQADYERLLRDLKDERDLQKELKKKVN